MKKRSEMWKEKETDQCKGGKRQVYLSGWLGIYRIWIGNIIVASMSSMKCSMLSIEYIREFRIIYRDKDFIWEERMRRRLAWPRLCCRSSSDPRSDPGERAEAGQARAAWAGCRTWRGGARAGRSGGARRAGGSGCCNISQYVHRYDYIRGQWDNVMATGGVWTGKGDGFVY